MAITGHYIFTEYSSHEIEEISKGILTEDKDTKKGYEIS
jgi:hypothetical protein